MRTLPPIFSVQRAFVSFCAALFGLSGQISLADLPALIAAFSPSVLRCFGAGTRLASTIWPPMGTYPFFPSCQSKAFIARFSAPLERRREHPARTFPGDLGERVLDRTRLAQQDDAGIVLHGVPLVLEVVGGSPPATIRRPLNPHHPSSAIAPER